MKTNLKKAALMMTGVLLGGGVFAQTTDVSNTEYVKPFSGASAYNTWSIGINGGLPSLMLATGGHNGFDHWKPAAGYGLSIRDQLVHSFGLQLDYNGGTVKGGVPSNVPYITNNAGERYTDFSTKFNQVSLSGVFNFATVDYLRRKNAVQFFLNAGLGVVYYTPTVTGYNGTDFPTTATSSFKSSALVMPIGGGVKFRVSDAVAINLGYNENFIDANSFNGVNQYPKTSHYSYGYGGIEFFLGSKSKPHLQWANPITSIQHEYLTEEQRLQSQIDAQKAINDQLRNDINATNANLAKFTTDSDGDGVADFYDKCPGTPSGVKVDGSGCPLPVAAAPRPDVKVYVTEEDRKIVKEAIRNLEFDFGKATIRAHSYPSLDRVAQLLIDKNFSLKLAGHTDAVGSNEANLRLSKDRAESIKSYLVSKGANPSRIEATGYGESQPIATNKTAKGRQMNRRVEFTLF
ncbi:OmpA family protein [Mucilaginibacter sp. UR6-11]|uniref:OmpA family protein n=1 Tax=Mucilaginibacter sp. UR6-11 TaxID=1435644 RepID=UPI001E3B4009|nr:OmpA family protein [Mucilaginibacter sp. UR6-11]MCC8426111.1 OmpA family protein [Mucilaginibacter sp. UR6-11]